jgi:hypothetical protein
MQVFEDLTATDEVRSESRMLLAIGLSNEGDSVCALFTLLSRAVTGVNTDTPIVPQVAEKPQELTAAAADFDDIPTTHIVPSNQMLRQGTGVVLEV